MLDDGVLLTVRLGPLRLVIGQNAISHSTMQGQTSKMMHSLLIDQLEDNLEVLDGEATTLLTHVDKILKYSEEDLHSFITEAQVCHCS